MAKTDGVARIIALAALGKNGGSSTGGTTNYLELANKPKINNVELTGNKTLEDLGINIPDLENYYTKDMVNEAFLTKTNTTSFTPTGDYNPATKKYVDDAVGSIGEPVIYVEEDNSQYKSFVLEEHNPGVYVFKREPYIKARTSDMMARYSISTIDNTIYLSKTPTSDDPEGTIVASYISNDLIPCRLKLSSAYAHGLDIEMSEKRSRFVSIGGRETISGEKTFRYLPKLETEKTPTADLEFVTKKYVDDNVKTYTAGENITISEDNVISANVSGGTDANAVYTYYAPYSDEDWFTEGNVANILQTVRDKGYSNFELCTLNGTHYALRKGGNLQALTTTEEYYELEYLPNDLKNYVYYFFVARLNEGGKIVVDGLGTQTYTAQEMVEANLSPTLEKMSGYDGSVSHLILQSNNGIFEWDSSLDCGIFGDSYTDPTYYTEKQVDKIVTDTVNEALGGRY